MEKSFGLFFHLKKSMKFEKELAVYMRITTDGLTCEISTKRKCDPDKWNAKAGRMTGKGDYVNSFNSYLDTLQQKVFESKRRLLELDKKVTAENIKNLILGKSREMEL